MTLPVLDEARERAVTKEVLEVSRSDDGTLTLLHSPAFVDGLAGGDVVMLAPDTLSGFRVVRRGGNVSIVLVLTTESHRGASGTEAVVAEVVRRGGVYDGGPNRTLVFTVPVQVAFGDLEQVFTRFCSGHPGSGWWFGNVYDRDENPLKWWASE